MNAVTSKFLMEVEHLRLGQPSDLVIVKAATRVGLI
jgi:hypothetical protein